MSQPVNPPFDLVSSKKYETFTVSVLMISLGVSAQFAVSVFDENGTWVYGFNPVMEGVAYQLWGGDDNYVYEWVNQQIQDLK